MSPVATLDTTDSIDAYDKAAEAYARSLPPEHYMESIEQSTQRGKTVETFKAIARKRPRIRCVSELLILYRLRNRKKLQGVCPDNFVVISDEPIGMLRSYNLELQGVKPILVMEYVSNERKRKDYKDNYNRYQNDLQIPYYLIFEPAKQKLIVYRLEDEHYVALKPSASGLLAIPELDLEMGLLDGWLRFWFEGELVVDMDESLEALQAAEAEIAGLKNELKRAKQG